jgi:hypothetical protein
MLLCWEWTEMAGYIFRASHQLLRAINPSKRQGNVGARKGHPHQKEREAPVSIKSGGELLFTDTRNVHCGLVILLGDMVV